MKRTENSFDVKRVLSVIERYSLALYLLDDYDHQKTRQYMFLVMKKILHLWKY